MRERDSDLAVSAKSVADRNLNEALYFGVRGEGLNWFRGQYRY